MRFMPLVFLSFFCQKVIVSVQKPIHLIQINLGQIVTLENHQICLKVELLLAEQHILILTELKVKFNQKIYYNPDEKNLNKKIV